MLIRLARTGHRELRILQGTCSVLKGSCISVCLSACVYIGRQCTTETDTDSPERVGNDNLTVSTITKTAASKAKQAAVTTTTKTCVHGGRSCGYWLAVVKKEKRQTHCGRCSDRRAPRGKDPGSTTKAPALLTRHDTTGTGTGTGSQIPPVGHLGQKLRAGHLGARGRLCALIRPLFLFGPLLPLAQVA